MKTLIVSALIMGCFILLWIVKYPEQFLFNLTFKDFIGGRDLLTKEDIFMSILIWVYIIGFLSIIVFINGGN